MDEFIREVDEDYRRERIAAIWRRFGGVILAAAVLLVAGVGGWRYWQHRQDVAAQDASTRFDEAARSSRAGRGSDAERILDELGRDAPAGYKILARFRLAGEAGAESADAGTKAFDALAGDPAVDAPMQDLARLRAAMLRMDGDPARAVQDLERLAAPANPWRHTAREMLGVAGLRRGDADAAARWFDLIAADRETPAGLRSRLEIYTALAAGGSVRATQ